MGTRLVMNITFWLENALLPQGVCHVLPRFKIQRILPKIRIQRQIWVFRIHTKYKICSKIVTLTVIFNNALNR